MLNKLKKAVKYIVKKVKQGVKIMARTINDTKYAIAKTAEVGINVVGDIKKDKLDMIKSFGKTASNIVANPHNRITTGVIGICLSAGFIITGVIDTKRTEV